MNTDDMTDEQKIQFLQNIQYRMNKNEEISIEEANFYQKNRHLLNESGNFSKADINEITEARHEINANEPLTKGEFVTALDNLGKIIESKFIQFDNKFTTMINNSAVNNQYAATHGGQTQQTTQKDNSWLKEVAELVIERLKQSEQSSMSDFERNLLEKSKNEMMESVSIVSLINKKVKSALVSDIAGNIAENILEQAAPKAIVHGPG